MRKEKNTSKKKLDLMAYSLGAVFLFLESAAFLMFQLGNSILAYVIIGAIVALFLTLVSIRKINLDNLISAAFFIFPIVIFGLITAISVFGKNEMNNTLMSFCLPIGLLFFSYIGFLLSLHKEFKLTTLFTVIFATLSILTLINLLTTLIQFGPFHTFTKDNYFIYYAGAKSTYQVSEMAYALMGFSFKEVTVTYMSIFPSLLLTSVIGLFFISPKKQTKLFVFYCLFTLISVLSLALLATKFVLVTDILIVIVLALIVLKAKNIIPSKVIKILAITLIILFVIAFILIFLNGQTTWAWTKGYRNLIAGNALLNKLFNNSIVASFSAATQDLFGLHILGHVFGNPQANPLETPLADFTNSWFFDLFVVGGLFGVIFFVAAIILGFRGLYKYCQKAPHTNYEKSLLAGFILVYFTYTFINSSGSPYIFYKNHLPMYYTGPFFIIICLLSYAFNHNNFLSEKVEVAVNEN